MPFVMVWVVALVGRPATRKVCQGCQRRNHLHKVGEVDHASVFYGECGAAQDLPVAVLIVVDGLNRGAVEHRLGREDEGVRRVGEGPVVHLGMVTSPERGPRKARELHPACRAHLSPRIALGPRVSLSGPLRDIPRAKPAWPREMIRRTARSE